MVVVLAGCAVEVLVDDVLAGAFINKIFAHVSQHGTAAPDFKSFATMNADKRSPAEIVSGDVAEHDQNIFGRYSHRFHPRDACVTILAVLGRQVGYEMEINCLNQFRMTRIWE